MNGKGILRFIWPNKCHLMMIIDGINHKIFCYPSIFFFLLRPPVQLRRKRTPEVKRFWHLWYLEFWPIQTAIRFTVCIRTNLISTFWPLGQKLKRHRDSHSSRWLGFSMSCFPSTRMSPSGGGSWEPYPTATAAVKAAADGKKIPRVQKKEDNSFTLLFFSVFFPHLYTALFYFCSSCYCYWFVGDG